MVRIDMEQTGRNLRNTLSARGMKVAELANALGVTRCSVYNWLRGKSLPTIDNLMNICSLLDCWLTDIVEVCSCD